MHSNTDTIRPLQRTFAMISIVIAMLVASMDTTIINTTMPLIAEELGGMQWYAWTFTSYMIFSTVMAPIAGRLSDLFGRRTMFAVGLGVFTFGSLLCGYADTMLQLVLYRAVQGIGAGLVMPFPLIIAGDLYPVEKRGKIQALFSAMWGLSAVLAPIIGSFFVAWLNWRWIFWVNIPLCAVAFVFLFAYKDAYTPRKAAVDVGGAALFTLAIGLLLGVTALPEYGLPLGAAGALLLAAFWLYERRHRSPIVPLSLLHNRPNRWMIVIGLLSTAALFGTSSYIPLYLQHEGYSILLSAMPLLTMSIGWMLTSVPAGKWVLRYGYGPLITAANALVAVSGVMLALLWSGAGLVYTSAAMFIQGVGYGLIFTVLTIGSQQLVGPHEKGVSTSLQLFARNIGSAISVTVMGALLNASPVMIDGMRYLFRYGLIVAVATLLVGLVMYRALSPAAAATAE